MDFCGISDAHQKPIVIISVHVYSASHSIDYSKVFSAWKPWRGGGGGKETNGAIFMFALSARLNSCIRNIVDIVDV